MPVSFKVDAVDLRLVAAAAGLVISCLILLVPDAPNDDAYTYIRTAEIALDQGIAAAVQYYPWAAYSLLIALVSQLGFDLLTSAYLVNALFHVLLVYSFLSIVQLLNDSKPVMVLAALCILLYPQLNEFRFDVIRDLGYWALALFALWQFMRYWRQGRGLNLAGFCLGLLLAAAFRPEALAYLVVTPFALLLDRRRDMAARRRSLAGVLGLTMGLMGLAALALAMGGINVIALLLDFLAVYLPFLGRVFNPDDVTALATAVFGEHAAAYSGPHISLFLFAGLSAIFMVKLFSGVGGPYFWILLYGGWRRDTAIGRQGFTPALFFMLANALMVFLFILVTRYVSSRYSMLFCLLLVTLVPLILAGVVQRLGESRYRNLGMRVLVLFFGYCLFDSFISFGQSKLFVYDSADWIAAEAGPDTELLTNNNAVAYFSGRVADYDKVPRLLTEQQIRDTAPGDLVAVEMYPEMPAVVERLPDLLEFQAAFPAAAPGDEPKLVIYRRVEP